MEQKQLNNLRLRLIVRNQQIVPRPLAMQRFTSVPVVAVKPKFHELLPKFLAYARYDLGLAPKTVAKYSECLRWVMKDLPHISSPGQLTLEDITLLKQRIAVRGAGYVRTNSILFALRKFLAFCIARTEIDCINPKDITLMKIPKRDVIFLTEDEVNQFLGSMNTETSQGLRMRALTEFLLGTGLRISEALSLNHAEIDWQNLESTVIGKGNKQRTIFITPGAKLWALRYLDSRKDTNPALFVTFGKPERLKQYDLSKIFKCYARVAGITKKLTPHILRHTAATIMLRNGCNIRYIQEILGHSDIETTAKYYLGTDKQATKAAHAKFLRYDLNRNKIDAKVG